MPFSDGQRLYSELEECGILIYHLNVNSPLKLMFASLSDVDYHIAVKTGDIPGGSSDSNVFVKLYGEKGDTSKMLLVVSANNLGNYFETGRIDIFTVETFDIGQVTQRRQQHVLMSSFQCLKCLDKLGNNFLEDFRVHSGFIHTDDMT